MESWFKYVGYCFSAYRNFAFMYVSHVWLVSMETRRALDSLELELGAVGIQNPLEKHWAISPACSVVFLMMSESPRSVTTNVYSLECFSCAWFSIITIAVRDTNFSQQSIFQIRSELISLQEWRFVGWNDGSAVLTALPEVQNSIPSNLVVAHNHL